MSFNACVQQTTSCEKTQGGWVPFWVPSVVVQVKHLQSKLHPSALGSFPDLAVAVHIESQTSVVFCLLFVSNTFTSWNVCMNVFGLIVLRNVGSHCPVNPPHNWWKHLRPPYATARRLIQSNINFVFIKPCSAIITMREAFNNGDADLKNSEGRNWHKWVGYMGVPDNLKQPLLPSA